MITNFPFKNLVFKGGGVKGIAYVGALKALEIAGIMPQIKGYAGTSAGAITASLASLKISSNSLNEFLRQTNYENFKDGGGIIKETEDLLNHFGLYQGNYFLNDWYRVFLENQKIDPNITFAKVKSTYGNVLKIFSTNLNTQSIQTFSPDVTPDVMVADAVRASMSIPMFFQAWKFENGNPSNDIFVDGGVMYNYPIDTFDDEFQEDETLGLFLTNKAINKPNSLNYGIKNIETYVKSLFESLMNSQDNIVQNSDFEKARTIQINDLGISATDFSITAEQAQALYNSGLTNTQTFLNNYSG
ncbi:MAG TPA: patatin-like phospholipase family protein [Leadbetterella sp.]|nr:patatin-like phospholipase family protein [Leadbetterella sp.]